jgi:hypothetical protein
MYNCTAEEDEISFPPPVDIGRHDSPFLQKVAASIAAVIMDEKKWHRDSVARKRVFPSCLFSFEL